MGKNSTSNIVRKLRFENGEMTQSALAKLVHVSRQTIVAVEKGDYTPSLELAFKLAYVFSMTVDDLFSFDSEKAGM